MPRRAIRTATVAFALVAPLAALPAQDPTPPPDSLAVLPRCDGRVVSEVRIDARDPNLGRVFRRSRTLTRLVQQLHVTTKEDVLRRILVLRVGHRCTELRRAESERLLRAQPYLSDARVVARDDGMGGVRLEVTTWDELALVVGLGANPASGGLTAARLGSANLMGEAVSVAAEWKQGGFYRDMIGGRITDYQILGRPYTLSLQSYRQSLGRDWLVDFSHPYFTDLQRIAWRAGAGVHDAYIGLARPGTDGGALYVEREYWDLGGVLRIGVPGRLSLFGASVSNEIENPSDTPVRVTKEGILLATEPEIVDALTGRYRRHRNSRVNALWGVRNIGFRQVRGFEALTAFQDVRVGFQFGTLFGRSLPVLGSDADDIFVSADLYAANGNDRMFLGLQLRGEGREDGDTQRWDGVLTSGRAAWYQKPGRTWTMITNAEWGLGWRQRVPFQLGFSDMEGGLRGFRDSRQAGAQRIVLRNEHRFTFGTFKQLGDIGGAAFVDAGRIWAGDAPLGVDTRPHAGVGIGLLAAVPPRSKRLWRIDVAFPVAGNDPDVGTWELRISSRDRTRSFYREPSDVRSARERSVPASVFNWP